MFDFQMDPTNSPAPRPFPKSLARAKRYKPLAFSLLRFYFPNILAPRVPLSSGGKTLLAIFRRDGVIRIDEKFRNVADGLDTAYFTKLETATVPLKIVFDNRNLFVIDVNQPRYRAGGVEISVHISFKDPMLAPLFFDPDLNGLLYNYYRRQPFFRNQPLLQKISYNEQSKHLSNGNYHVDHLHQVSIMLLVCDITETDTHMQYALGSHRFLRSEGFYAEVDVERRYKSVDLTGKKGTLFMFDAAGIHRAKYVPGTSRKILHLNFTTGHHTATTRYDKLSTWPALTGYPIHSRRLMEKIGVQ